MVGLTVTPVSPVVYEAGSMFALNEISFSARYGIFPFTGSMIAYCCFFDRWIEICRVLGHFLIHFALDLKEGAC